MSQIILAAPAAFKGSFGPRQVAEALATAICESATACGIRLLSPTQRDPLRATTRGVGELIWEAVERGARTVVVGLGGSATVDGGTGAARGFGWTFLDAVG